MKKFVSLFLIAVLCIAVLPLQAFAAEDHVHSEECSRTDHVKEDVYAERVLVCTCSNPVLDGSTIVTIEDRYISHNNSYHKMRYKNVGLCLICSKTATVYTYGPLMSHNWSVYDGSCNGTMQTLQYSCRLCNGHKTVQKNCPGGPHIGGCNYLPV
ncbi:MAG: hypothetical protein IKZ82_05750 [Clostridia bacterium]|nr:hypothetical protein [Clostridia bacterium]MBR5948135.1 hypothetical protein [Clostridia bacterium]